MINIKKLFPFTLSLILILVITGCSITVNDGKNGIGSDKRVSEAIETISDFWGNHYDEYYLEDKYLKIINTRIINIKDNISDEVPRGDMFEDIDYIVEFELLSNYYNTAPYYVNIGTNNCVTVYKDGTADVQKSPFDLYRSRTFSTDFSPIIESIEDFDDQYNQIIKFE